MVSIIERVSHEITILLQCFQASCKGSLKGGHGRVPITKQSLFLVFNSTSISCRHCDNCYRKEEATPRQEQDSHRGEEIGDVPD